MENLEFWFDGKNFKTPQDVKFLNPLVMAFVGDGVYSLYVKSKVLNVFDKKVKALTSETAKIVNAKSQKLALFKIFDDLTNEELEIVHRARNANINTKAKNYSIEEYRHATALEALIGYLYLSKQQERLSEILDKIFQEINL